MALVLVTKPDAPLKTGSEVHQNLRINDTFPSALPATWAVEKKTQLKSLSTTVTATWKNKG